MSENYDFDNDLMNVDSEGDEASGGENFSEDADDNEGPATRTQQPRRSRSRPRRTRATTPRRRDRRNAAAQPAQVDSDDEEVSNGSPTSSRSSATPPPPPPQQPMWDMVQEELFASSDLNRMIRQETVFGPARAKEPVHLPIRTDPLSGHRLDHSHFPQTDDEANNMNKLPPERVWDDLVRQFGLLSSINQVPQNDYKAQVDFFDALAIALETANDYPHRPPTLRLQNILTEQLMQIGSFTWNFYIANRTRFLSESTGWWMVILELHKVAIEKLPNIHEGFLHVYNTTTVGDFLKMYSADKESAGVRRRSDCWLYMLHACSHGFVGRSVDTNRITSMKNSCVTQSLPDERIAPKGTVIAERAHVEKTPLELLYRPTKAAMRYRFCDLPFRAFMYLLSEMCTNAVHLSWTPATDFFFMLLWYHFCRLAIDGEKLYKLLNSSVDQKRKAIPFTRKQPVGAPDSYRPLSGRFLRDAENMFINHLEIRRGYYKFVETVLERVPSAPMEALRATPQAPYRSSLPVGFFDTVTFPECRQFLPTLPLLKDLDESLINIYLGKGRTVAGVEPDAVLKIYFASLVASLVPPGTSDAVLRKQGAMNTKPSFILDATNRSMITPVAQLTFKHLSVCTVLGYLRGHGLFSHLSTDPMQALIASIAYTTMLTSVFRVATFSTKPRSNLAGSNSATPTSTNSSNDNETSLAKLSKDYMAKYSDVSATGAHQPLSLLAQLMKDQRQVPPINGIATAMAQSRSIPEVETIRTFAQWIVLCEDKPGQLAFSLGDKLHWAEAKQNWPKMIILTTGEILVVSREGDFVFRTQDPLEALSACYHRAVYTLGNKCDITTPYLSIFEKHMGTKLRKIFSLSS